MAPEQAAGRLDRVGPLSDIYGLGAILYSLLTGRPPFHAPTQMETLVQVIEGEPIPAGRLGPGLPRTIEHVCMRCLEKEPDDRYASAGAVAEELEKFLRGDEIEWDQPGLWNRLRRWSRREPALVARLAAAGAALEFEPGLPRLRPRHLDRQAGRNCGCVGRVGRRVGGVPGAGEPHHAPSTDPHGVALGRRAAAHVDFDPVEGVRRPARGRLPRCLSWAQGSGSRSATSC